MLLCFQREDDAVLLLPSGRSLGDVYDPIKEAIARLLLPVSTSSTASTQLSTVSAEPASTVSIKVDEPQLPLDNGQKKSADVQVAAADTTYYDFDDDEDKVPIKEEKLLLSEIEQFRLRQQQRDK